MNAYAPEIQSMPMLLGFADRLADAEGVPWQTFERPTLYLRGNVDLLERLNHSERAERFALTGARAATTYGVHVTGALVSAFEHRPAVLVVGAGYGIEAGAIQAALAYDVPLIVVMAGGLDRIYPHGHADLIERVLERGGLLISLAAPGEAPTKERFHAQGRLMAAISDAVVIVEAGQRSGALRVADAARAIGTPIGAVPGPVTSPASNGTNRLLGMPHVKPILTGSDVFDLTLVTTA